ncbi:hypothetical protein SRS16CHR_02701 [Variovorax sp. SRS16]|uniref:hypothetical protein n=1 Tax=Variovorax sp. SRS16 TaxID=282217 RepID=UPI0013163839|nr:hypothetical protein [Variovorax sp. SRS16]VTU20724.1 hypothetical protein SRS16CHR_02701 [Variovorax sp. SRS16]
MKTTVKLDNMRALVIEPQGKGVSLSIRVGSVTVGTMVLDQDKCGAVLFGIEQAAEQAEATGRSPLL